jgi:hypothetical protein
VGKALRVFKAFKAELEFKVSKVSKVMMVLRDYKAILAYKVSKVDLAHKVFKVISVFKDCKAY